MSSGRMMGAKRALNSPDKKVGMPDEGTAGEGSQLLNKLSDDSIRHILPRLTHSDLDNVSLLNRRLYQLTKESRPKARLDPARNLKVDCSGNANVLAALLNRYMNKNVPKTVNFHHLHLEKNYERLDELKQWIIQSKIEDLNVICLGMDKFISVDFLEQFANSSDNPSWSLTPSMRPRVPIRRPRDVYVEYGTPLFAALSQYCTLIMDHVQVAPDRFMQLVELRYERAKKGRWNLELHGPRRLLTDAVVRNWNRPGTVIEQDGENKWMIKENGRAIVTLCNTGAEVLPYHIISVQFH